MHTGLSYRVVEQWDAADSTHDTPSEVVIRMGQGRWLRSRPAWLIAKYRVDRSTHAERQCSKRNDRI